MTANIDDNKSYSDYAPLIVVILIILTLIIIPFKILSYGYLPSDDALRHVAKSVSGRSWQDILVIREDIKLDSHPGWHAILSGIHKATGLNKDGLLSFSVIALFLCFFLIPVFLLTAPEAWILALLIACVINPVFLFRIMKGRPLILTMSFIPVLSILWPRIREKKAPVFILVSLALFAAASTFIHASWYALYLPVLCFFLAKEFRAASRLFICVTAGIIIGSTLTGHPILFIKQTLTHAFHTIGSHSVERMLVKELRPYGGDISAVICCVLMLMWIVIKNKWDIRKVYNPIFILAVTGWIMGFISVRFWTDLGMPAFVIWLALELQEFFSKNVFLYSKRRIAYVSIILAALFLSVTADVNSRWTSNLTNSYLSRKDPEQSRWLPRKGGIVYSNDMRIFYDTFYENPHAEWKYVLGFEAAMMKPEDLAIFRKIQWNYGADEAFLPWVRKMTHEDRLILRRPKSQAPNIPGLKWYYAATNIWIGRKP